MRTVVTELPPPTMTATYAEWCAVPPVPPPPIKVLPPDSVVDLNEYRVFQSDGYVVAVHRNWTWYGFDVRGDGTAMLHLQFSRIGRQLQLTSWDSYVLSPCWEMIERSVEVDNCGVTELFNKEYGA